MKKNKLLSIIVYNSTVLCCFLLCLFVLMAYTVFSCPGKKRLTDNELIDSIPQKATFPDSIIIYYQWDNGIGNLKFIVTADGGNVSWSQQSKLYGEKSETHSPQDLCEWQREEIVRLVTVLFVKKEAKVVESEEPTKSTRLCPGPMSMQVYVYNGFDCISDSVEEYTSKTKQYFSKQFHSLWFLLAEMAQAYNRQYPWSCDFESYVDLAGYRSDTIDSVSIDIWKPKENIFDPNVNRNFHIKIKKETEYKGIIDVTGENGNAMGAFEIGTIDAGKLFGYVTDLFSQGEDSMICKKKKYAEDEEQLFRIPFDMKVKIYQGNTVSFCYLKLPIFQYFSVDMPIPLGKVAFKSYSIIGHID